MGMSYTNFLEYENKQLKEENLQLKEQIDTSQTSRLIAENNRLNEICIYWENEHDKLLDENEKIKKEKKIAYKWGYSLEKDYKLLKEENEQLKEKIDNLTQDLQNRCNRCIELYNKNEQLKQQITQLKNIKRNDHKTIERLIKIITDEHYN